MSRARCLLTLLVVLGAAALLPAQDEDDEPPLVGRPPDFSGAVGDSFTVAAAARPTTVQVEQPLTFTVTVTAEGLRRPPKRPDLSRLPSFSRDFYVEDLPDDTAEGVPGTFRFVYQLKPRRLDVKAVPALSFVYFKPRQPVRPFRTELTKKIPLTVQPRTAVSPNEVVGDDRPPPSRPDALYDLVTGPGVLRAQSERPPALAYWALLGAPPLVCAGWYLRWRRRHPEAVALARRRSAAARQALAALRGLRPEKPDEAASGATAVLTRYLGQRTDLSLTQPTPAEVAEHLRRWQVPAETVERVTAFYHASDAARFAALTPDGPDWPTRTADLIHWLETAPWPPSS